MRQELLDAAVNEYYNALELINGRLRLKACPGLDIVNARDGAPLALPTVAGRRDGSSAIRDGLGFAGWQRGRRQLVPKTVAALQMANNELGGAGAAVGSVELQDLKQTAKEASYAVHRMKTTFTDAEINEILGTMHTPPPPLNLRELRGLDKAMQTIRGELTNNLAKLSPLDDHIALEQRKHAETEDVDEFTRRRVAERLRSLEDERSTRLEAAAASREALRSKINRIRETIHQILNEDTTLAERFRTLFREQGVTIASILTALGMTISTLVLALTGGGGGTPTPALPSDKGGLKEWVKKTLQSLARALAKLAGKAAAALPCIIGGLMS